MFTLKKLMVNIIFAQEMRESKPNIYYIPNTDMQKSEKLIFFFKIS